MDQILMFVGASSDTWDYAKTYLRIVCVSGPFVLIANCYSNVIRAEGQSGRAMMGQLLGNLLNVVLAPSLSWFSTGRSPGRPSPPSLETWWARAITSSISAGAVRR